MKTTTYRFEKEIPVLETDILVTGSGPGGLGAAVMAARQGAKVMVAERYGAPGGMATFGEVSPFMMNHLNGAPLDGPVFIDWCRKLWEYRTDDAKPAEFDGARQFGTYLDKNTAMLAMEDLYLESGVKMLYHHNLIDAVVENGKIREAIFSSKSGLVAIRAKEYIDSTGDGDLAVLAGCPAEFGNAEGFCQPMTLCFKLQNVDKSKMPPNEEINRLYREAKAAGEIDCPREDVLWFHAWEKDVIHFNTTRVIKKSGVSGIELSEAEIEARHQVRQFLNFLRNHVAGFEHSALFSMAHHIGVRESRRIRGELYQTEQDFMDRRKYPDAIARLRYAIDIHNPSGTGTTLKYMPDKEWYELSYRTLIPVGCGNLLMGCRAISVDHALHSSIRVMPQVCTIGQAAGMAAVMAIQKGCTPRELDGVEIRRKLIQCGASL